MLSFSVMLLFGECFIPAEWMDPSTNPFISPNLASNELLKQMPPCQMFVGDKDPFHDQCVRFT